MIISNLLKDNELLTKLRGLNVLDEIQVSTRSSSKLGQALSPDWKVPFVHPKFGYFSTIQSYWTWLISKKKDNSLRTMYSSSLNRYQHEHGYVNLYSIRSLIAESLVFRVLLSGNIRGMLINEKEYRFSVWYTTKEGQRRTVYYSDWYSRILHDLQTALKTGEEFTPTSYTRDLTDMQDAYDEVFALMSVEEINDIVFTEPKDDDIGNKANVITENLDEALDEDAELEDDLGNRVTGEELDQLLQEAYKDDNFNTENVENTNS